MEKLHNAGSELKTAYVHAAAAAVSVLEAFRQIFPRMPDAATRLLDNARSAVWPFVDGLAGAAGVITSDAAASLGLSEGEFLVYSAGTILAATMLVTCRLPPPKRKVKPAAASQLTPAPSPPTTAPPSPMRPLDDRNSLKTVVIKAGKLEVHVSPFGATIVKLLVPDRTGRQDDVVLGFDTLKPYEDGTSPYFGAVVGRVANRIAGGTFTLDGVQHRLATNNGPNHLHGGIRGFDKVWWTLRRLNMRSGAGVRLTYTSPDGEEGYPGRVTATVTYTVREGSQPGETELTTEFLASADKRTPLSLAQHTYWNLGGHGAGDCLAHQLRITATAYTPVGPTQIPTGELRPVLGTPFDFTAPTPIGARVGLVPGGYDHNYALQAPPPPIRPVRTKQPPACLAATVLDPFSGRGMDLYTDAPGMQLYTGNFLDGSLRGKGGVRYGRHAGFCLETQQFPDAVNQPNFPSAILSPGETYRHTMVHAFYAR